MKYKIIVPSMGRPEVFAISFVPKMLYPETYVVVFDDETPKYKDELRKLQYTHVKVIGIDRDIIGKSAKLNWCIDNLWMPDEKFMAFFDDDIKCMRWRMSRKLPIIEEFNIPAILEESYHMCEAFGSRMISFAYNTGVRGINRKQPIRLHESILGGAYMQTSDKIKYDTTLTIGEDVDVTLMELFNSGIILKDNRYGIDCILKMHEGEGGMKEFRSTDKIRAMRQALYNKYGMGAEKYIRRAM